MFELVEEWVKWVEDKKNVKYVFVMFIYVKVLVVFLGCDELLCNVILG